MAIASFYLLALWEVERRKDEAFREKLNSYENNITFEESQIITEGGFKEGEYMWHRDVVTTVFWVGEEAGEENGYIANNASAWDVNWTENYGGVDDPERREGYLPKDFTPSENPFYFALPYNDFDLEGKRKAEIFSLASWADGADVASGKSVLKNRWIRIFGNGRVVYAQWEDVGPFEEDDRDYVFGSERSKNTLGKGAGLDVSPAVRDYLQIGGLSTVYWQFVDEKDVPDGPWRKIITTD